MSRGSELYLFAKKLYKKNTHTHTAYQKMVKDIIINITYCGLVPWGFANNGELPENALAAKRGTADLPAVKAVAGAMSEAASMAIFMVDFMTKGAESEIKIFGGK